MTTLYILTFAAAVVLGVTLTPNKKNSKSHTPDYALMNRLFDEKIAIKRNADHSRRR